MNQYLIMLIVVGLVSFGTISAQAEETIVIGDFEGPGTAQFDGWSVTGANPVFAGDDVGVIWSSTGNGACAILFNSDNGFQWNLQYTDLALLARLAEGDGGQILADVYWLTSDWNGSGLARWDAISLNSDLGWLQTDQSMMGDTANPSSPGEWDTINWGSSHERTVTWDFSTLLVGATPDDIINGGFAQLNLSISGETGAGTSGIFYIDNIRMIVAGVVEPNCINPPSMDTNNDCQIDLIDFAVFAGQWMTCGYEDQEDCWR